MHMLTLLTINFITPQAWEEVCAELGVVPLWQSASDASRRSLIVRLSDHLELCHRSPRMRAARAILYIAQVYICFFLCVTFGFEV